MTQINLLDAIKIVQDSFTLFTDLQLNKFNTLLQSEIDKRKSENNYNPKIIVKADNANVRVDKKKGVDTK